MGNVTKFAKNYANVSTKNSIESLAVALFICCVA